MIEGLPTLDDVNPHGKSVLLRIDINSPILDSTILDTTRFESHVPTLKELEDCKLVILAHQSRPGKKDFTTLENHARVLSRLLGREVEYIDEVFSTRAVERIKNARMGDVILLENIRFYAEEQLKRSPEEHSSSFIVRKLYPHFAVYINDAFSASHRAHASLVGFPPVIPSVAGRLVEKEVLALTKALKSPGRKVFILGGAKIDDSVKVLRNVLVNGIADKVVLTGVVATYFFMLKGYEIGEENKKIVEENKGSLSDDEMRKILNKYGDKIVLPIDLGVEVDGNRENVSLDHLDGKGRIMDIGVETIEMLKSEIPEYDIAVINGPAGVFEDDRFALGTFEVLKAVSKAGYSVVGGGHISTAARMIGIDRKMSHVSTGGGASLMFLSGEKLVALEVLKEYWDKRWSHYF
jgi:phosphoglycerate kinase